MVLKFYLIILWIKSLKGGRRLDLLERPLISPQIENVFYKDNKLNISIKLYSTYNIYCNKNVVTNLIIENENKIYKHSGNIIKDIFIVKSSKMTWIC